MNPLCFSSLMHLLDMSCDVVRHTMLHVAAQSPRVHLLQRAASDTIAASIYVMSHAWNR